MKRRIPKQQRAKERVEHILSVVEKMIIEVGTENLQTNEIAKRAGVPVGSIYQYFSGLEGLIGALVDRHLDGIEQIIATLFGTVNTAEEFLATMKTAQDAAWGFLAMNPWNQELWYGAQSWPSLRRRDWAVILNNADAINAALCRVLPNIDPSELRALCIAFCNSDLSNNRMGLEFPDLRESLKQESFAFGVARFMEFSRRNLLGESG